MAIQIRQPGKIATPTIQTSEQGLSAAKTALSEIDDPNRRAMLRRKALEDIAAQQNIASQQFDQRARQTGAARGGVSRLQPTGALLAQQGVSADLAAQEREDKLAAASLGLGLAGQETQRSAQQAQLEQSTQQFNEQAAQQASQAQAGVALDERRIQQQEDQFAKTFGIQKDQLDFNKQMALKEAARADVQTQLAKEESERAWQTLSLNKEVANNNNILALRGLDQQLDLFNRGFANEMAKMRAENANQRDMVDLQNKYANLNQQFQNAFQIQLEGIKNNYEQGKIKLNAQEQRSLQDYMDQIAQRQEDRNRGWSMLGLVFGTGLQAAGNYFTTKPAATPTKVS